MDDRPGLDRKVLRLLQKHNSRLARQPLSRLIDEPGRFQAFSRGVEGLLLDFSRVLLDAAALDQLTGLARHGGVARARERLFGGRAVNRTENRPALHMLLRGGHPDDRAAVPGIERAAHSRDRMLHLAGTLHGGVLPGSGGQAIRDIVHVGIGGSLLGTRLLVEALGRREPSVPRVHFLGSVDAHPREELMAALNPEETLVIVVSKSFRTGDTLLHASRLRDWQLAGLGGNEARLRMIAVTGSEARALEFGIPAKQVLHIPDWVGGRYSLWSAVSLSAAAVMGPEGFRELLDGAASMDRHFQAAPVEDNLPVMAGLLGVWHRNVCGYHAWGVIPYDQRLRLLPAHLQQLVMESNGKSVTHAGVKTGYATAPVVFGETGTEAQHSLFQHFHQGTDIVPLHLVGVIRPAHGDREAHEELLANMLAQATALATGRSEAQTLAQMSQDGVSRAADLLPHRSFEGNRPSEILLLDELTPASLGRLLALYEHRVFVESVIWNINAFDQWGVELGKQLTPGIRQGLATGSCGVTGLGGLLGYIRDRS